MLTQQRNYLSLWHSGCGKIKTYINNSKKINISISGNSLEMWSKVIASHSIMSLSPLTQVPFQADCSGFYWLYVFGV